MPDIALFVPRLRRFVPVALLTIPLVAFGTASAGGKPAPGPVSHHALGETVSLGGCQVTVTGTRLANEPDPRLAVEVTIAEVGAGEPGRCHLFFVQGEEGELQSPEVATSSMTVERDAPVPAASAFFLFKPSALPTDLVFAPLGDDGPRAMWVAP